MSEEEKNKEHKKQYSITYKKGHSTIDEGDEVTITVSGHTKDEVKDLFDYIKKEGL